MNYFVVKTKNEDVLLKTDYKKIKGAEVKKAFRYFIESFVQEPIEMYFVNTNDPEDSLILVTVMNEDVKNFLYKYKLKK